MNGESMNPYEPPQNPGTPGIPVRGGQLEWTATAAIEYGVRAVFRHPISIVIGMVPFLASLLPTIVLEFVYVIPTMNESPDVRLRAAIMMYAWLFALMPLQTYFLLGQLRFSLAVARGQAAGFKELFAPTHFGPFLVAYVLFYIAFMIGLVLCCVPAVLLTLAVMPFPALICDGRAGILDSFRQGFEMAKGQWLSLFVFLVLSTLVYFAGFLALCVGILVALPAIYLAYAYVYLKQSGEEPASVT
jgi:uncharacterized membrane protein